MLRRLPDAPLATIRISVDGREVTASPVDSVAAALMLAGVRPMRMAPVSGAPRDPYCLMGVCFECLVTIDGTPNRQACMVPVREGMRVETGLGKPELEAL